MQRGKRRAWQVRCPEWILGDSNIYPQKAWQAYGLFGVLPLSYWWLCLPLNFIPLSLMPSYSFYQHCILCRHYWPCSHDKEGFFLSRHAEGVWVEEKTGIINNRKVPENSWKFGDYMGLRILVNHIRKGEEKILVRNGLEFRRNLLCFFLISIFILENIVW